MLLGNQQQMAYSNVQVQANASVSNSFELIFMLHERLDQEIDVMIFAIENHDLEKKSLAAQKAIDILTALDSSLDLNNSNELINNIHNLYEYSIREIFKASKDLDVSYLLELKQPLADLKEGWQGLMNQQ
ncbi:flagellar export chaperone FliS [Vibrio sp. Vb2880]|uniref:Flagellar export chaperone FliS n=1 Tax=Vibrio furnissii TaxID=29494 RepID=A0A0Q2R0C3_VIBFU|nr:MULTISPECIES: flagellar export chaperone FliS [Vibrio]ADT87376.1 flagellar protein FliS [Vibrio furnissii NCTC 11218]EEX41975.1 flagellar biosynthesis protein FliS [Vibrio furnissii CIP 102972]KQH85597.1 flagellar export chaperone FliS [Vibrio furnissii]MBO0214121.1 flagellar export chaperone FliS [Vibrio sp. Vb2880]MCG6215848.1 flagellar export chaperone FliS [Vibrio furnissii]